MSQDRVLSVSKLVKASRKTVWRAITDPDHLKEWWCPKPWTTEVRAFDLRPGGDFHTFMRGPDGGTSDNPGCFLEIVPEVRLVWTSLMVGGWQPIESLRAMSAIFALADEAGGTRFTGTAKHPSVALTQKHKDMGFHEGWGIMADQLGEYAGQMK